MLHPTFVINIGRSAFPLSIKCLTNLHLKTPLQVAAPQEINPPESRNRIKSQLESETESQAN